MEKFIETQKSFNAACDTAALNARKWNYATISTIGRKAIGEEIITPKGVAVISHAESRFVNGLIWHLLKLVSEDGKFRSYTAWSVDASDDGYFSDSATGKPLRYI